MLVYGANRFRLSYLEPKYAPFAKNSSQMWDGRVFEDHEKTYLINVFDSLSMQKFNCYISGNNVTICIFLVKLKKT